MIKKVSLAALVLLAGALAPFACGGGASSNPATDFCGKYAKASCARQAMCPDPNAAPGDKFDMNGCVQFSTAFCTNKVKAGDSTPTVYCYGKSGVDMSMETACLSAISSATCDQVNMLSYDDLCGQVCTNAPTTGAAGAGGSTGAAGSTGAGGSGGGNSPTAFCMQYATAVCQKGLACPDPSNPPPVGFNMDTCTQAFNLLCAVQPTNGTIPAVNCAGATTVDASKKAGCLSAIAATTCDQINGGTFTYDDICSQVCSGGTVTGAGGATGAAGSTGAAGAGSAPADAMAFCLQFSMVDCDRAYECVPPAMRDASFVMSEGNNITECKGTITTQACDGFGAACGIYDPASAQRCLSTYATETCDQIFADGQPPADCFATCN